jgi:hypothetical protein
VPFFAASFLFFSGCTTTVPRASVQKPPTIAAPARPIGVDVLPRWRASFEDITRALLPLEQEESLSAFESADSPLPPVSTEALTPALDLLGRFTLAPGDTLVLPPIHGPETPFPDHQPLRQVASLRTIQARRAIASGDLAQALNLVRQNLAQARATLSAQEGLIPLIHATGVWQCALDGAHALARSPRLSESDARSLLAELQADKQVVSLAISRAFIGEYLHVYRVIVDRMPRTDDPELLLSSVASLGMAEPEALAPGEIGLGITDHLVLDRDATLAAYEADIRPYLAALAASPRLPRGLHARHTVPVLAAYIEQLGAFYAYTSGEAPTTLEQIERARAAMESTPNPVGKLLAVYLTPDWEMLMTSAFRREAQRAAVCGLLAWRIHGRPASWEKLVAAGVLDAAPADPFTGEALLFELNNAPRVWSVFIDGENDGGQPVEGNNGQPEDLVWIW